MSCELTVGTIIVEKLLADFRTTADHLSSDLQEHFWSFFLPLLTKMSASLLRCAGHRHLPWENGKLETCCAGETLLKLIFCKYQQKIHGQENDHKTREHGLQGEVSDASFFVARLRSSMIQENRGNVCWAGCSA